MDLEITLRVNGATHRLSVGTRTTLLDALRERFGGVAPVPWRAARAEAALRGAAATGEVFGRAAEAELANAQPLPGNAFKVPLARHTLVRTLLDLTEEEEKQR
jgi:xanthine dehydrogenase YagS FAD-binding subunit